MRHVTCEEVMPTARLFERLVREVPGAGNLAEFRNKVLQNVACEIGADSGSLLDPPGTRFTPRLAHSRSGALAIDSSLRCLFVANRARYERSAGRLLRAMSSGRPVIDADVYGRRDRDRLDVYVEILRPRGSRSMLCAAVHHRGRALCQLVLNRHGRGVRFRDRDAASLAELL